MSRKPALFRPLVAAFVLGLLAPTAARAQAVTLDAKSATISEITSQLERQTGYDFRVSVSRDAENARHEVHWKDVPLAAAVAELMQRFNCEVFSIDSEGFYVIPMQKEKKPLRETQVGNYRLRMSEPSRVEGEPTALQMTLMFTAPDEEQMEAIAGLGPDFRVIDNFGRSLAEPMPKGIQGTAAIRVRLAEYWQRLQLAQADGNAVRIRSLSGSLVLYRKVTPVRVEIPIDPEKLPQEVAHSGVKFRLEKVTSGGKEHNYTTHLSWPEALRVVGRGISRTPLPYLVDDTGRVYRDSGGGQPRRDADATEWEQRVRFEEVEGKPVKLVYDVLLKEDPSRTVPFRVTSIPLPIPESSRFKPEQRPFYDRNGGVVSFQVTDRNDRPMEGAISLGLSRKSENGWGPVRWIEVITDADGKVRVDRLQPGTYRVSRAFRQEPASRRIEASGRPLEITVAAGKEGHLPTFKLPLTTTLEP
jgi:hypothetical protein